VASHFRKEEQANRRFVVGLRCDMNSRKVAAGNVHECVGAIMGYGADECDAWGFKPKASGQYVIVGAGNWMLRNAKIVKKSGIHVFTMRDIDERGNAATDGPTR